MGSKRVGMARIKSLINENNNKLQVRMGVVESIEVATKTLTKADSGKTLVLNRAGGIVLTLPAPEVGMAFKIVVGTTFTGAGQIQTNSTDVLYQGGLQLVDPATAGDTNFFAADVSNDDTIDLGKIEQGWLQGGVINLVAVSSTRWHVDGRLLGDATLETPFE
tara:strand:- start:620 stop:1108 length:489 start_codon:yes stop_codon:yes gene_type:complete